MRTIDMVVRRALVHTQRRRLDLRARRYDPTLVGEHVEPHQRLELPRAVLQRFQAAQARVRVPHAQEGVLGTRITRHAVLQRHLSAARRRRIHRHVHHRRCRVAVYRVDRLRRQLVTARRHRRPQQAVRCHRRLAQPYAIGIERHGRHAAIRIVGHRRCQRDVLTFAEARTLDRARQTHRRRHRRRRIHRHVDNGRCHVTIDVVDGDRGDLMTTQGRSRPQQFVRRTGDLPEQHAIGVKLDQRDRGIRIVGDLRLQRDRLTLCIHGTIDW